MRQAERLAVILSDPVAIRYFKRQHVAQCFKLIQSKPHDVLVPVRHAIP